MQRIGRHPAGKMTRALLALCLLFSVGAFALASPTQSYAVSIITKTGTPSVVTIGDTVTYTMQVTVPAGQGMRFPYIIEEFTAGGLEYVPGTTVLTDISGTPDVAASFESTSEPVVAGTASKPTFRWDFQDIDNRGQITSYVFDLSFDVQITGVNSNGNVGAFPPAADQQLGDRGTLYFRAGGFNYEYQSNPVWTDVDQPLLDLFLMTWPDDPDYARGQTIQQLASFGNSGYSPAYDITLDAVFSGGLENVASFAAYNTITGQSLYPVITDLGGGTLSFDFEDYILPAQQAVNVLLLFDVSSSATIGVNQTASYDVDWSSLPGDIDGERVYDDQDWEEIDWTADSQSKDFLIADQPFIKVTKTRAEGTPWIVPVGADVTFDITLENSGSQAADGVGLYDSWANTFLSYLSSSVAPDSIDAPAGWMVFDDLTGGDGLAVGESVSLSATFETTDTIGVLGLFGPVGAHNMALGFDPDTGPPVPSSLREALSEQLADGVVDPDAVMALLSDAAPAAPFSETGSDYVFIYDPSGLAFTKDANPAPGTVLLPGEAITYSIDFEAPSTYPMVFARIVDELPDSVDYIDNSMALEWLGGPAMPLTDIADGDVGEYDAASHTVSVDLGQMFGPVQQNGAPQVQIDNGIPETVYGRVTFSVRVRDLDYSFFGVLNQADLYAVSEGGGAAAATTSLLPVLGDEEAVLLASTNEVYHPVDPIDITKVGTDVNGGRLVPGDEILWEITVENVGLSPTTNVVITDSAPTHTTYVPGSITGIGADDSAAPDFTWNIGVLPLGGSATVSFRTTVDAGVPSGTIISNQALVESDDSLPKLSDEPATPEVGDPTLLSTGGDELALLVLGALVLAAGLVLALKSRGLLGESEASA